MNEHLVVSALVYASAIGFLAFLVVFVLCEMFDRTEQLLERLERLLTRVAAFVRFLRRLNF